MFSLQIQREREEMERRDLRKMIMDGEAKQKELKKKQQVLFHTRIKERFFLKVGGIFWPLLITIHIYMRL